MVSPFKPNYRVCLVNSYLIETVRKYFVSPRCQKSARGVIAYQLLTRCSIDSIAQALQSLHRFAFIVILRRFFQQLALDITNSDASSAAVRVLVSFYLAATDNTPRSSTRTSAIHKEKFSVLLSDDQHKDLFNFEKH